MRVLWFCCIFISSQSLEEAAVEGSCCYSHATAKKPLPDPLSQALKKSWSHTATVNAGGKAEGEQLKSDTSQAPVEPVTWDLSITCSPAICSAHARVCQLLFCTEPGTSTLLSPHWLLCCWREGWTQQRDKPEVWIQLVLLRSIYFLQLSSQETSQKCFTEFDTIPLTKGQQGVSALRSLQLSSAEAMRGKPG